MERQILLGEELTRDKKISGEYNYLVMQKITDWHSDVDVAVVEAAHPDFVPLLSKIKLLIVTKGSKLSHLCIVAREFGKPVLKVPGIIAILKKTGRLKIVENEVEII